MDKEAGEFTNQNPSRHTKRHTKLKPTRQFIVLFCAIFVTGALGRLPIAKGQDIVPRSSTFSGATAGEERKSMA
jgi:hypothetical protein